MGTCVSVDDGEPRALPSTIAPGGGRTELVTESRGDDVNTTVDREEQIHAGPNGLLDTSVATDDDGETLDKVKGDRLVLHVSPAECCEFGNSPRAGSFGGR